MSEPGVLVGGTDRGSGAVRDVVAVLGVFAVAGVAAGVLWWLLVDPAMFTTGSGGGLGMGEDELGKQFDDDGWFAVLGAGLGLLTGGVVTWWRSRDPLLTAGLVLVGAVLASLLAVRVGGLLGPPPPAQVAGGLAPGTMVPTELVVTGRVLYLVWPVMAMLGTLVVLWAPVPEPGPEDASPSDRIIV